MVKTVRHVGKSKKLMTKLWTHRIHGVGIYANGGILMGSHVTIYSSTMDPMGESYGKLSNHQNPSKSHNQPSHFGSQVESIRTTSRCSCCCGR